MKTACLVATLLLGLGARADGLSAPPQPQLGAWRVAVAGGLGHAYGLVGAHVELRRGHWAGFVGFGYPGGPAPAVGFKWFAGEGRGFVVSLHADLIKYLSVGSEGGEMLATVAATAGYRWHWDSGFFSELGIGPAYSYYRYRVVDDTQNGRSVSRSATGFGALGPSPDHGPLFPEITAGMGFEF